MKLRSKHTVAGLMALAMVCSAVAAPADSVIGQLSSSSSITASAVESQLLTTITVNYGSGGSGASWYYSSYNPATLVGSGVYLNGMAPDPIFHGPADPARCENPYNSLGTVTITADPGYVITKVEFQGGQYYGGSYPSIYDGNVGTVTSAPFTCYLQNKLVSCTNPPTNNNSIGNCLREVRVYGYKHTHDDHYGLATNSTANDTLTWYCGAECPSGAVDADHKVSLTLTADSPYYSCSTVPPVSFESTEAWTGAGLKLPTIKYVGADYAESANVPTTAGTYTAKITVGDKTASVDFKMKDHILTPATETMVGITLDNDNFEFNADSMNAIFAQNNISVTANTYVFYQKKDENRYRGAYFTGSSWMSGVVASIAEMNAAAANYQIYILGTVQEPHVHKFAADYSKDATGHWYACTGEGCTEKKDFAAHVSSGAATAEKAEACAVCGYVLTPRLNHVHSFGVGYTCSCGLVDYARKSVEDAHVFNSLAQSSSVTCYSPEGKPIAKCFSKANADYVKVKVDAKYAGYTVVIKNGKDVVEQGVLDSNGIYRFEGAVKGYAYKAYVTAK